MYDKKKKSGPIREREINLRRDATCFAAENNWRKPTSWMHGRRFTRDPEGKLKSMVSDDIDFGFEAGGFTTVARIASLEWQFNLSRIGKPFRIFRRIRTGCCFGGRVNDEMSGVSGKSSGSSGRRSETHHVCKWEDEQQKQGCANRRDTWHLPDGRRYRFPGIPRTIKKQCNTGIGKLTFKFIALC